MAKTNGCNKKSAEASVDKTESMSTLNIVCLQYKYEEILKHYEALFQAYDKRCHEVSLRDSKLLQCRQRMVATHAQIAHAHNTLLTVGEKYLVLKKKSNIQRKRHKEQLKRMRQILHEVVAAAEDARLLFDARLSRFLANNKDSDCRLLIQEIRKYNRQILENIPLKELLAEYMRGSDSVSNLCNDFENRK